MHVDLASIMPGATLKTWTALGSEEATGMLVNGCLPCILIAIVKSCSTIVLIQKLMISTWTK